MWDKKKGRLSAVKIDRKIMNNYNRKENTEK